MCKHCEHLTEDREVVHKFMEGAAKRLSQMHGRPISPDHLNIRIELELIGPPLLPDSARARALYLLQGIAKEGI